MKLTYFAYGSNMLTARLADRVPSTRPIDRAVLPAWELTFGKQGSDGSAKCTVVREEDSAVHGVLFHIDASERHLLDRAEGLGYGYEIEDFTVRLDGNPVDAFAYVATHDYIDTSLAPFHWYHALVLEGAREHDLPEDYLEWLESIRRVSDPNPNRAEMNRRILLN